MLVQINLSWNHRIKFRSSQTRIFFCVKFGDDNTGDTISLFCVLPFMLFVQKKMLTTKLLLQILVRDFFVGHEKFAPVCLYVSVWTCVRDFVQQKFHFGEVKSFLVFLVIFARVAVDLVAAVLWIFSISFWKCGSCLIHKCIFSAKHTHTPPIL